MYIYVYAYVYVCISRHLVSSYYLLVDVDYTISMYFNCDEINVLIGGRKQLKKKEK